MKIMDKPSEILNAAADLLSAPGVWMKGTLAIDDIGAKVDPTSDEAACWCAEGAIIRKVYSSSKEPIVLHLRCLRIMNDVVGARLYEWNDSAFRTQEQVIKALRRGATAAEEQGE